MEPWDGPASIAFTDGIRIGAILDRNGLRPSRFVVTKDGLVVMASEVGVLDVPPDRVVPKGRLQPGRLFLVDTAEGRIVPDDEIKDDARGGGAVGRVSRGAPRPPARPARAAGRDPARPRDRAARQETFGYTLEDVRMLVNPMADAGTEPIGSMGTDIPLAVLSERAAGSSTTTSSSCSRR